MTAGELGRRSSGAPAPHSRTRVSSHSLKVSPRRSFRQHSNGPLWPLAVALCVSGTVREFKDVDLVADMTIYNPFDFFVDESATAFPFEYPRTARGSVDYRKPDVMGPLLARFMRVVPRAAPGTVNFWSI